VHRKLKEQLEAISSEEGAQADLQKILETPLDDRITLFALQPAEFAQQLALLHKKLYMSLDMIKMVKTNYEFTKDFGPGGNLSMAKDFKFRETSDNTVIILDLFSDEVAVFHQQFEQVSFLLCFCFAFCVFLLLLRWCIVVVIVPFRFNLG
jgi:hypothetical protein